MENTIIEQGQFMPAPIRSYSHKELTDLYEVSHVVFRGWLAPHKQKIGKLTGKRYTIKQVQIIFSELGQPRVAIKQT